MRLLILMRHGQYDLESGRLTARGRLQAATTVKALRGLDLAAIHSSTLPRAKETAAILKKALGFRGKVKASPLLRERLPTPVPGVTKRNQLPELRKNLERMRRGHARLVRPARGQRTELVVVHGNLIRMFVCLTLELKLTTWLKMRINHCSLTVLLVTDAKAKLLVSFNETGHLPKRLRTLD